MQQYNRGGLSWYEFIKSIAFNKVPIQKCKFKLNPYT